MTIYWPDRDEEPIAPASPPTFFEAFGYWKLAIILEGVYARYAAGQYGKVDPG